MRILFSRNFAYAKFRESKTLAKISNLQQFTLLLTLCKQLTSTLANSVDPVEMQYNGAFANGYCSIRSGSALTALR